MPAEWLISYWPEVEWHAFLSHCQEDRESLVLPVFEELKGRSIVPWIDKHHYPQARDPFEALKEELLRSRHVIYFVTPAALRQGRGWMAIERAFAATIQQRLRYGDEIAHFELPLLFVPTHNRTFQRSTWRGLLDKAVRCPMAGPSVWNLWRWRDHHVRWAADAIEQFFVQEVEWATALADRVTQDPNLRTYFHDDGRPQLTRRILAQSPQPWNP